jgi:hypothetical protein
MFVAASVKFLLQVALKASALAVHVALAALGVDWCWNYPFFKEWVMHPLSPIYDGILMIFF